jgi:uncharacterized SAM-binding protein YcdF (DUF218 family)
MFFLLSKLLMHLLFPVVWVLALLLFSFFSKKPLVKKRCLGAALILFLFFSNEWLATRAYMLWEEPAYPISDIRQPYDVGIIMGGFTDAAKEPRDRVYLNKAVDRMMHAVQLYRMGLVKKLLPSGGSSIPGFTRALEADMIRKAMLNCLVNPEDIIIENRARNTRENAQFSAEIIRNRFPGKPRILVFTSAFHCRRTRASFEKTGLDVDLFPVDFRYNDPGFNVEKALIPSDNAWSMWSILFHEIAGYIVYLCMGYA